MLLDGAGVDKDDAAGLAWLRKAAEQGRSSVVAAVLSIGA